MTLKNSVAKIIEALALLLLIIPTLFPQSCFSQATSYGQNKAQWRNFQWYIFETPHFTIYYYPEEEKVAQEVCQIAEQAFQHDTKVMGFVPTKRIPIFLYLTPGDFEQTNVVAEDLGDGVGGVTEMLKNRITIPAGTSEHDLTKVITHEMVHALQFDVMYGEGLPRTYQVYRAAFVPQWLMEGTAEYGAQDWDNEADMFMRDAVINERIKMPSRLYGFEYLDGHEIFLAYKTSQAFMQYLSDNYGPEKIGQIFKKFQKQLTIGQIIKEVTGKEQKEVEENFRFQLMRKYWTQSNGLKAAREYAKQMTFQSKEDISMNLSPAWSPDGKQMVFLADKAGYLDIYLMNIETQETQSLVGMRFESISGEGNPVSWSPDQKELGFVARERGKDKICIYDISTHVINKMDLPLDDVGSPVWSPDGKEIAFKGSKAGQSDLYVVAVSGEGLRQLNSDRADDTAPSWSPDGRCIAYTTEKNSFKQIALIPAKGGTPTLLTGGEVEHRNPHWSPDGRKLIYSSDENGFFCLYTMNRDGSQIEQLTSTFEGDFSPSYSPGGGKVAFSSYSDSCFNIYVLTIPSATRPLSQEAKAREMKLLQYADPLGLAYPFEHKTPTPVPVVQSQPKSVVAIPTEISVTLTAEVNLSAVNKTITANTHVDGGGAESAGNVITKKKYEFEMSPDLFLLLAGYDSAAGFVGGGYISLSDMPGDHQMVLYGEGLPSIQQVVQCSYTNSRSLLNYGISASYAQSVQPYLDTTTNQINDYNQLTEQVQFYGILPLSRFDRIESGPYVNRMSVNYNAPDISSFAVVDTGVFAAYVHDQISRVFIEPISGFGFRFNVSDNEKLMGGNRQYTAYLADFQDYFNFGSGYWREAVLGFNLTGEFLDGGYADTSTGLASILTLDSGSVRGLTTEEAYGNKLISATAEFRIPSVKEINYDVSLPFIDAFMLRDLYFALFTDCGYVWDTPEVVSINKIKNSVGTGLRLAVFVLQSYPALLRFDVAQRTDNGDGPAYYFALGEKF